MNSTVRKSKAQKGYELLREASGSVETLYSFQLYRIAKAINPALEDFQAHFEVLDDMRWLDTPGLSGSLMQLHHCHTYEGQARRALVFFREEIRAEQSRITAHDVRLCYRFPGGDKRGEAWLDAETGLPWFPQAYFQHKNEEQRRTANERLALDTRLARGVLAQLTEEENTSFGWQYGDRDYNQEREIEVLQFCRRKNKKADWKVEKVFATRYHPAGSLLPRDQQEQYRQEFLARQEALAA